jgi:hypothetical protein
MKRKNLYEENIPVIVCFMQFKSLNIKTKENKILHKIYLNKINFPNLQKTDIV